MSSSQIYIARDDDGGKDLVLGPESWSDTEASFWFGGSTIFPFFSRNITSPRGTMSLSFDGIAAMFFGNTNGITQDFTVKIDDGETYTTSTTDPDPQTWMQWYQTPDLEQGRHRIEFGGLAGTAIDLIAIVPGPDTSLESQTLMVDDSYVGIEYTGSGWEDRKDRMFDEPNAGIGAKPFLNGTHETSNVGDSLTFQYTGSVVSVHGVMAQDVAGSISLSYTIDSSTPFEKTHTMAGGAPGDLFNFLLLESGPLSSGNHTITVNLTGAVSQSLIVDYILFSPGYSTLATMPNLTASANEGSGDETSTSSSPISTATQSAGATSGGSSGGTPVGPIVGGVIGGIAGLALLAGLLFWLWRRRQPLENVSEETPVSPFDPLARMQFHPFIPPPPMSESGATGSVKDLTTLSFTTPRREQQSYGFSYAHPASSRVSSDQISPLSATTTSSTSAVVQRQLEIRRRLQELQELVAQSEGHDSDSGAMATALSSPSTTTKSGENIAELRRRIQALEEENGRLAAISAPPAYAED